MATEAQREAIRARVVDLCAGLPELVVEDGRHVGLSVRGKRFAWLLDDHHGDGRLAFTCKAPPGENTALADRDPARYFLPSYTASRGWAAARRRPGGLGRGGAARRGRLPACGAEATCREHQRA